MSQFGWKKDKFDRRDYLHIPRLKEIPPVVILDSLLPNVRDQGSVGSCVGFGIGANLVSKAKTYNIYEEWFSPTWIYNGARFIEGSLDQDIGCFPKDALDWLVKMGTLLERFWPYDPIKLDKSAPSTERQKQAVKYEDFAYYRVDNGIEGICSAIADGHFVSIGSPWFEKWLIYREGVFGWPILKEVDADDNVAGGHETCLYGYDKNQAILYGMNSWGTDWGISGFYQMHFSSIDVFKEVGGYDAHYITFSPTPLPPLVCIDGEKKCEGYDLYECQNNQWVLKEQNSATCGYMPPEPSTCKWGQGMASFLNKLFFLEERNRKGRFYYK
jgi:hypothetical protein